MPATPHPIQTTNPRDPYQKILKIPQILIQTTNNAIHPHPVQTTNPGDPPSRKSIKIPQILIQTTGKATENPSKSRKS